MTERAYSSDGRALVFNSSLIPAKASRSAMGVGVMNVKARRVLESVRPLSGTAITNISRYRVRTLPAAGALLRDEDRGETQLSLIEEE